MRIPRSVIVMGLVTAVPFGLGIRDALTKKPAANDGLDALGALTSGRSSAERERELAAYEEEMRREAEEREERSKARLAKLDELYGSQPASMGVALDGLELGGPANPPGHIQRRIDGVNRDGLAWISLDGATTLDAVQIVIHADYETTDPCDKLNDALVAAWGHSVNGVWVDTAKHQRATLSNDDSCELRFERYLDPADFVAELPLSAIGKNADAFAQQLGEAAEYDGDRMYRVLPGVGAAKGLTRIEIFAERGRIICFTATSGADFDSLTAIRDALSARLKAKPTQSSDEDNADAVVWEWKNGRTPVSLVQTGVDTFSMTVGKLPWD